MRNQTDAERRAMDQELDAWWKRNWGRRIDLGAFATALPLVLEADLAPWSKAALEPALAAVGWPADASSELAVSTDDCLLFARREPETGDPFGEFRSLDLYYSRPDQDRDAAFVTALAHCVQLLGTPDLVGGSEARAIWHRPTTIVTLVRRLRPGGVHLRIESRQARETKDDHAWQTDEYRPTLTWLAWPDDSRHHDIGPLGYKEPDAPTLEAFEHNLDTVFNSLSWDLPVLYPHATNVIWQLTTRSTGDWLAHGWFCAYAAHHLEIRTDAEPLETTYPHGPASGRDIATQVKAAVAAAGITAPDQLGFEAWMSPEPQALQAFRLGLQWSDEEPDDVE